MPVSEKNIGKSKRKKGRPKKINEEIERQIINLAKQRKTNGEIAEILGLGVTTVRDARKRLIGNLHRGARRQDKQLRKRRHKLHHGDKCPTWLYGVWPGSPEWPRDEEGNPLWLVGWDSCPVGRRLLQGNGWARAKIATQDRAWNSVYEVDIQREKEEEAILKDIEMNNKIHTQAMECYREDQERKARRNTLSRTINRRAAR